MTKKKREKGPPAPVMPRLLAGRFVVNVKTTHDVDGSSACNAHAFGDSVSTHHVENKHKLAELLRTLANEVSCTENDFDNGSAYVVVLRRYSHQARKRLSTP